MSEADFSVWVGCLACYNEGTLKGEWGTWREYADEAADELLLPGVDSTVAMYFDYDKWANDLEQDYWHASSDSGVFVFRYM